jgi:hypothetical protein
MDLANLIILEYEMSLSSFRDISDSKKTLKNLPVAPDFRFVPLLAA